MISAQGLRVGFGQSEVLHGIDIEVKQGCVTALVGANGAGKTTLLRALSRLLPLRALSSRREKSPKLRLGKRIRTIACLNLSHNLLE